MFVQLSDLRGLRMMGALCDPAGLGQTSASPGWCPDLAQSFTNLKSGDASTVESAKGALTNAVTFKETIQKAGRFPPSDANRGWVACARELLMNNGWTNSGWGVIGPKFDSSADLIKRLNNLQTLMIVASGAVREDGKPMINPTAITPTGAPRVDSPLRAGASSLAADAEAALRRAAECSANPAKCAAQSNTKYYVAAGVLGVLGLAWAHGRGMRR